MEQEVKTIKASSRASIKIRDNFYTFEYCEERTVNPSLDINEQRQQLWTDCNIQVDNQISEILDTYK